MLPPDERHEPDIFIDTRRTFHDLRGQLTVITNAADLVRADTSHPLSERQEERLAQIKKTTNDLAEAISAIARRLLESLALFPAGSRIIWRVPCRQEERVLARPINRALAEMRVAYPLHTFATGIIVAAEPADLTALRHIFAPKGCQVRLATTPADVPYLLEQAPAELIVMAPPLGSENEWWRALRLQMPDNGDQPLLMQLDAAPPAVKKPGDGSGK